MIRRNLVIGLTVLASWLAGAAGSVSAQGLIWDLPEDGTWVRYEGTYEQVVFRPNAAEGNMTVRWIRQLTLKSVGKEMAEYKHPETSIVTRVPCRWIEIKVVTGNPSEGGVDSGPVGARIFKVLVPESRVLDTQADGENIKVSFLPIIKGYRKIGERDPEPIKAKVLQIYPLISLLMHYKSPLKVEAENEDPDIRLGGADTATKLRGVRRMESPVSRTRNEATLWRCKQVPFGLAKWTVNMVREAKNSIEPRSAFELVSEVSVEMSAHEMGHDAQSEVATP